MTIERTEDHDELLAKARKYFDDEEWEELFCEETVTEMLEEIMGSYKQNEGAARHHLAIVGNVCDEIAEFEPESLEEAFKVVFAIKYSAMLMYERLVEDSPIEVLH